MDNLQALINKYANAYNLSPSVMTAILNNIDITGGFNLPTDAVGKAIASGELGRQPDISVLEGRVEAATAYVSTVAKQNTDPTKDLISIANQTIPTLEEDRVRTEEVSIRQAMEADLAIPVQPADTPTELPQTAIEANDALAQNMTGIDQTNPLNSSYGQSPPVSYNSAGTFGTKVDDTDGYYDQVNKDFFASSNEALKTYNSDLYDAQQRALEVEQKSTDRIENLPKQPSVQGAFDGKAKAYNEAAEATDKATKDLTQGLDNNQARNEEAFKNTYKLDNLDANDPNYNSRVNAIKAELAANADLMLAGSKAARRVSQARPFSREGIGKMLFGNVYAEGVSDVKAFNNDLKGAYDALFDANQKAYEAATLTNIPTDVLKTEYEAAVTNVEAQNKAKVFTATKDIASYEKSLAITATLNNLETNALNSRLKVLELGGKQVDAGITKDELAIKALDVRNKAYDRQAANNLQQIQTDTADIARANAYDERARNQQQGRYDTTVNTNIGSANADKAKVSQINASITSSVAQTPKYQSDLARLTQAEVSAKANGNESLASSSKATYIQTAALLNVLENSNYASDQLIADQLKLKEATKQLLANADISTQELKENDRLKLEQSNLKLQEDIAGVQARLKAGYPTVKSEFLVKELEAGLDDINQQAEVKSAVLSGLNKLLGVKGTASELAVVPPFLSKSKSKEQAKLLEGLINFNSKGRLADSPLEALGYLDTVLSSDLRVGIDPVKAMVVSEAKSFGATGKDAEKSYFEFANRLKAKIDGGECDYAECKNVRVPSLDKPEGTNKALGFADLENVIPKLVTTPQGVTIASKIENSTFTEDYLSAQTPIEKLNAIFNLVADDTNDTRTIAGRMKTFLDANVQVNSSVGKLEAIGLKEQKGMWYKNVDLSLIKNIPVNGGFSTLGNRLIEGNTFGNDKLNLNDAGDLVKLMSFGYLVKKSK